jgi:hypothetical protein
MGNLLVANIFFFSLNCTIKKGQPVMLWIQQHFAEKEPIAT